MLRSLRCWVGIRDIRNRARRAILALPKRACGSFFVPPRSTVRLPFLPAGRASSFSLSLPSLYACVAVLQSSAWCRVVSLSSCTHDGPSASHPLGTMPFAACPLVLSSKRGPFRFGLFPFRNRSWFPFRPESHSLSNPIQSVAHESTTSTYVCDTTRRPWPCSSRMERPWRDAPHHWGRKTWESKR